MVHENVERIRVARGVTKRHIARGIKVTEMTYSRIANGESKLDVERLKIIAKLLGTPVATFFDEKLTDSVIKEIEGVTTQEQLA